MYKPSDVIALWPSIAAFSRRIGIGYERGKKWSARERIPDEWWDEIAQAAAEDGLALCSSGRSVQVTVSFLQKIHKHRSARHTPRRAA